MEFNDLLKELKKIDLELIKKSDIKMFENEKIAVDYYNDAVENVLGKNIDIAVIKLKRVLTLSPDFNEAKVLLEKLSEYEKEQSIGDRVYESMHGKPVYKRAGKVWPKMVSMNSRVLAKIVIVIIVIVITTAICIAAFNLLNKQLKDEEVNEISYSIQEVSALNQRIQELENNLLLSEEEMQMVLGEMTSDKMTKEEIEKENNNLKNLVDLYKAAVYFEREEYVKSADILKTLEDKTYEGEDKELFDEVYIKAVNQAANSVYTIGLNLFNQKDYKNAIINLEQVEYYNPDFEEIGRCYYIMGKSHFELDNALKAIELYEHIEMNIPSYENVTGLLYYTAKAYQKLNEYEKAKELYNTLIRNYPESSLVGHAKDRLKEMQTP